MNSSLGKGQLLAESYPDGAGRNGFPFFLKNGAIVIITMLARVAMVAQVV